MDILKINHAMQKNSLTGKFPSMPVIKGLYTVHDGYGCHSHGVMFDGVNFELPKHKNKWEAWTKQYEPHIESIIEKAQKQYNSMMDE